MHTERGYVTQRRFSSFTSKTICRFSIGISGRAVPGTIVKTLRIPATLGACAVATTLGLLLPSSVAVGSGSAAVARWEMNEGRNASVMHDATAHKLNGRIASRATEEGLTLRRHSHYHWSNRCATCGQVARGRVVKVSDDGRLEIPNPDVTYVLALRFRTTKPGGNYVQKGQATSDGGQIKVQAWEGKVECQFKGRSGAVVKTGSPKALDDGAWHTIRCVRTPHAVQEYVDGSRVDLDRGRTGLINNSLPLTVGGKLNCDQVKVECDYFSGSMDYIRIRKR
jgi:Laminin G domain